MAISQITASGVATDTLTAADIADDAIGTAELANDVVISTSGAITTTGAFTSIGIDDNSNALAMTIDSSERIGIGTATPAAQLDIQGPAGTGTASAGVLRLSTAELTVVDNDQVGRIDFIAPLESSGTDSILVGASIYGEAEATFAADDNSTALVFATNTSAAATERMRINRHGQVGIGTNAPPVKLTVLAPSEGNPAASGTTQTHGAFRSYYGGSALDIGHYGDGTVWLQAGSPSALDTKRKISINPLGGYVGIGINPAHALDVLTNTGGDYVTRFRNTSTNVALITQMKYSDYSPDDNTARFLDCYDSTTLRCKIASDGDLTNHDNSYGAISDERIKTDIKDANSQWDDIKAIKVRNFKRKDDVRQYGENAWEQIGVIAQEVEAAGMDKLIREGNPDDFQMEHCGFGTLIEATYYEAGDDIPEGASIGDIKEKAKWIPKKDEDGKDVTVKSMSYSVLYMKAIKALQEAMTRIEALEAA